MITIPNLSEIDFILGEMWEAFRVDSDISESVSPTRDTCHTCPKLSATAPFTTLGEGGCCHLNLYPISMVVFSPPTLGRLDLTVPRARRRLLRVRRASGGVPSKAHHTM